MRKEVGPVTVLYNNAGVIYWKSFLESDFHYDEDVIKLNLLSYMWTIREFLPSMISTGRGHIVSTCSVSAFFRFTHLTSYVASKYALNGFLETLKLEIRKHPAKPKIEFSTVYPAFVKTPMVNQAVTWEPRYNVPGLVQMDTKYVAEKIVQGILLEKERIVVPDMAKYMDILYR